MDKINDLDTGLESDIDVFDSKNINYENLEKNTDILDDITI
jgi:hypothetical protein